MPEVSVAQPERPGPWPASARFDAGGLTLAGIRATDLAARFGTPLLVFDEEEVRSRMRTVRTLFPRASYAVKAFTARRALCMAVEEGLDLLCASGGEVEACLRAGVPSERVHLHGNAKTDDELAMAGRTGLGLVIVDRPQEMERLSVAAQGAGRVQPVLLRVIPEVKVETHEAIATGHAESKFGTPLGEAQQAARRAASLPGLSLEGFHAHAGSQVSDVEPYLRVLETLAEVAAEAGVEPRILDIGGGFGVTYRDETALPVAALAVALGSRLRELKSDRGWVRAPELQVEPGRSIVANAAVTLYTVLARKKVGGGRTLIAVDGGMSDNLRPMLYGAEHAVAAAGEASGAHEAVTVVGRHCESGDVLIPEAELPAGLEPGDLVAVAATGAYTYPLASNYNRFGRPAVVGLREGGVATLWLRREDAADMDRLDVSAGRADPGWTSRDAEPPSGVTVRPARPADAPSFLDLWRSVIAEERFVRSEADATTVREQRRAFREPWSPDQAQIVAVEDGTVVGHVGMSRDRHPVTRHVATLGMAVTASRRGRGIGAALLAEGFRWAAEVGVEKLVLSVYPSNSAAISLYRRFGFVEEGRLSRQSRKSYGYEDEILMAVWIGKDPGSEVK